MKMTKNEQRKKLKETGLTPSYIEWMIWKTNNAVPEGTVQYQGNPDEKKDGQTQV